MTYLKRLGAAVVLTLALGLQAFGCVPGQIEGPPCIPAAQTAPDDPTAPGIIQTPPAIDSVDLISVAEIALNSLMLF
jgi:hypothetical protein